MGESTPHQVGRDICGGVGQTTRRAVAEGSPADPDDDAEDRFNRNGEVELPGCWVT